MQGWLGISLPSLCLGIDVFELLLSLDRLEGNQLVMTQELIANMLGVRREGVTEGALKLQHAGLIQYARGHITVLDRAALEERREPPH